MAKFSAIVLSAGKGSRMECKVHKQYLQLLDKPIIYYALKAFEDSPVDEIILVVGKGEENFCREELIDKYHLHKVTHIIEGGKERYHSVFNGLQKCVDSDYVLIHDGARPFLQQDVIERAMEAVSEYDACIAAVPVKDTIKLVNENAVVKETPQRDLLWSIQTPQAFNGKMIRTAYEKLIAEEKADIEVFVTDDAMVVERYCRAQVHIFNGSYRNLKITTPEDLEMAEFLMRKETKNVPEIAAGIK